MAGGCEPAIGIVEPTSPMLPPTKKSTEIVRPMNQDPPAQNSQNRLRVYSDV